MADILESTLVGDLVATKGRVISVPDTASVQEVLKTLLDNNVTAVPVAGSANLANGIAALGTKEVSTQYIGFVSVLDVVLHIADNIGQPDKELGMLSVNIMGQSNESRTMWTLSPKEKLTQALEHLCNGVHRFLVPLESSPPAPNGLTNGTTKSAAPKYGLLTQTDVVRFLVENVKHLGTLATTPVSAFGSIETGQSPVTAPSNMPLVEVIRMMRKEGGLTAMAVVEPMNGVSFGSNPRPQRGGKIVGTISATDFRGLTSSTLKSLTDVTVEQFLKSVPPGSENGVLRPPVTCRPCAPLATVMAAAIESKIHRVWVTNEDGWLSGVVRFSDILRTVRAHQANLNTTA